LHLLSWLDTVSGFLDGNQGTNLLLAIVIPDMLLAQGREV